MSLDFRPKHCLTHKCSSLLAKAPNLWTHNWAPYSTAHCISLGGVPLQAWLSAPLWLCPVLVLWKQWIDILHLFSIQRTKQNEMIKLMYFPGLEKEVSIAGKYPKKLICLVRRWIMVFCVFLFFFFFLFVCFLFLYCDSYLCYGILGDRKVCSVFT